MSFLLRLFIGTPQKLQTHFAPVNPFSECRMACQVCLKCRYVRPSARDSKRARFNVYMSHDWEYGMHIAHMLYFLRSS